DDLLERKRVWRVHEDVRMDAILLQHPVTVVDRELAEAIEEARDLLDALRARPRRVVRDLAAIDLGRALVELVLVLQNLPDAARTVHARAAFANDERVRIGIAIDVVLHDRVVGAEEVRIP